jgi:hypothetical protein
MARSIDADVRVCVHVPRHHRRELARKIDGRGDAQVSLGLRRQFTDGGIGIGNRLEAFSAMFEIDAPGLCQPDLARGAVEQPRPDARLEERHVLRNGRR